MSIVHEAYLVLLQWQSDPLLPSYDTNSLMLENELLLERYSSPSHFLYHDLGDGLLFQHNRAYDGHQIRVQLRENNHKSPAKFVRGRGRFPFPAPPEGEAVGVAMDKQVPVDTARGAANHGHIQDHSSSATQRINVNPIDLANTGHHTFTTFTVPHPYQSLPSPDTPSAPKERVMPYNPLRANSASTTNSASPSPSAVSQHQSSVSGAVPHYHYPMTMGYYPGQQWHYPAYPYAYPFMPTGYMPFAPPSYPSTPDNSGYPSAPYAGWVAVGDAQKVCGNGPFRHQAFR